MRLAYADRLVGLLLAALQELPDVPLFYSAASIGKLLHCTMPPLEKLHAAVVNAGYRVSQSHDDPNVVKTDAPNDVVWDIVRCWVEKHPVAAARLQEPNSAVAKILSKPPTLRANFDPPLAVREARRKRPLASTGDGGAGAAGKPARAKWAPNPEPNWGPKARAHSRGGGGGRGGDGGGGGGGGGSGKEQGGA